MSRRSKWALSVFTAFVVILIAGVWITWITLSRRLEPFLREQTIAFLEQRFDADVELGSLNLTSTVANPWNAVMTRGKGVFLGARGENIRLKKRGRPDVPPIVTMRRLQFEFELASVTARPIRVRHVHIHGFELVIPPKGDRPRRDPAVSKKRTPDDKRPVIVDAVVADGMRLVILPRNKKKAPLEFDLLKLQLHEAGPDTPIKYDAVLTNPKPPGLVESKGTFGPFDAEEPGESPLAGDYVFRKADLGVFRSIGGILDSTGSFSGKLNRIIVDGQADVPAFRLAAVKNTVPLRTKFHAIVDGTNGDTVLDPVNARLGQSDITVRGTVERYPGENGKTVALTAVSKRGRLDDFLRLAVKGSEPPLRGGIALDIKLIVPPGKQDYSDRLIVKGSFDLNQTLFTSPDTQAKLDDLSRRAQGKPNDTAIARMPSDFVGRFDLRQGVLKLEQLLFTIPGAELSLAGTLDLNRETLDFAGPVRTASRVSQMVKSRWKRLLLKPVDPIFAKDGAGAVFFLRVDGSREAPKFHVSRKPPSD